MSLTVSAGAGTAATEEAIARPIPDPVRAVTEEIFGFINRLKPGQSLRDCYKYPSELYNRAAEHNSAALTDQSARSALKTFMYYLGNWGYLTRTYPTFAPEDPSLTEWLVLKVQDLAHGHRWEKTSDLARSDGVRVYVTSTRSVQEVIKEIIRPKGVTTRDQARKFLYREMTGMLFDHPSLVKVWLVCGNKVAMSLAEGVTLEDRIKLSLDCRLFVKMLKGIASGLGYLHEKGWVHGDLKASNVMVDLEGKAVIIDLETVCLPGEGTGITTPRMVSPECAKNSQSQISFAFDVWSFGMMILGSPKQVRLCDDCNHK